jgi:NADPH:quinone reductase-like Zn-dependent oxidoreductase
VKAARIHKFGPPEVIVIDDIPRPTPGKDALLIRVAAAGVGPWDALIREGESEVDSPLPITLGSDLAGIVEEAGSEVSGFKKGDQVYGVTNPKFIGATAKYAVASAGMVAHKPDKLTLLEAASVPVVAVTAWQMLHEYAQAKPGQSVLIHGAAGNVGAYAVQIARLANLKIIATSSAKDAEYVKSLGAVQVLDYHAAKFEDQISPVDLVIDTVGGETRKRSMEIVKPGGILVSAVSPVAEEEKVPGVRAVFFLVEVTTARLNTISELFERGQLVAQVGSVLPLADAQAAHRMLAGAPHKRGKILLNVNA